MAEAKSLGDAIQKLIDNVETVAEIADSGKANYHPLYDLDLPLTEKIKTIAKEI